MIGGWMFPPQSQRRLIPGGRFRGTTPVLIAIMAFVTIIVTAAGLTLANAAGAVRTGVESRNVVQVPPGAEPLRKALASVRGQPGVRAAVPVPEAEMRRTLGQWLGPASASPDLPVPSLVTLDLAADADAAAIGAKVARDVPGARLIAYSDALSPLLGAMRALQWLALALVVLMAGATAAAVVLSARGALDTHRATIEVMHGVGATDLQVTHLFQRKIALDALAGAAAGGLLAGSILLLLTAGGSAAKSIIGRAPLDLGDAAILVAVLLGLVLLATIIARTTVLATLRAEP